MGYFVDENVLYDDIRTAETDQERGAALLEHLVAGLDTGYEPEHSDAVQQRYDEEIAPRIEDELGLETPETEVLRYRDSDQLMYDVVTALGETPVAEFVGAGAEDMLPENTGMIEGLTVRAGNEVNAAAMTKLGSAIGEQIGGITDPYAEQLSGTESDHETIAYNLPGVHRMADDTGLPAEEVLDYILIHEGIHAVQSSAHQPTIDARRDTIDEIMGVLENPEQLTDAVSLEMPSMTLMEGHAEFYTDRIADTPIRSESTDTGPDTVMEYILEIIMGPKREQYEQGAEFLQAVHDRGGDEYVQYTMNHPPESMEVFQHPDQWADHIDEQLD
jgi:hypothetical protein